MTNAMLRKQAWRTYWRNRGKLWILFTMTTVLNTAWYFFQRYVVDFGSSSSVLSVVYSLAITPITIFGLSHVLLRLIRGKQARVSMAFDLFKPPFVILKVYAAGVVMLIPSLFSLVVNFIGVPVSDTAGQSITIMLIAMFAIILLIWIQLRLFLFRYLVITKHNESIWNMIKLSFQRMKGQVRHLIWFGFTVLFPILAVYIILLIFFFSHLYDTDIWQTALTVFYIVNAFLSIFIYPYVDLSYTAYANNLLKSDISKST